MSMYDLNKSETSVNPIPLVRKKSRGFVWFFLALVIMALAAGFIAGGAYYRSALDYLKKANILPQNSPMEETGTALSEEQPQYVPQTTQEETIVGVVRDYSPAVVSIIISKDVPVIEKYYISPFEGFEGFPRMEIPQYRQKGTELQQVGGGSGFIVASDGMIVTNRHVVSDDEAEYTVYTQDGKKYPARVLAKDSIQDIAVLKIEGTEPFSTVKLGDSNNIQIGQTVIAIGNALGEFNNTVSVGVISGLSRTITAGGGGTTETLENIIQTDAAINSGNSGGPLFNLKGEVIGVNTAMAGNAQNIGFAIPVNVAVRDINQVKSNGKITYPFLGVNYTIIDDTIQKENNLPVNYGAWIISSDKSSAVVAGSAAEIAGLKNKDIILEFAGEKIGKNNTLSSAIMKRSPQDKVILKIMRDGQTLELEAILGERE
ncbi:MAG TPA: trypsin-like peptidase domain-containing protein [Candidatus Paceibacterota bacterium]|nr:trypsin-like peptidase domain-containing protein [Candidatus Pacearchaeota archaeon]HRZ50693.1 trypsin-like peptidase domain-containing protein [Candidatus Paceibacterota bacterium]HSA36410.1 trypsin-like peptidase domain-containing protein [Candidatus Paceibacterota bacterium]